MEHPFLMYAFSFRHYLYKRNQPDHQTGWSINSFNVTQDYKLVSKWRYQRNDGTVMPNSNLMTTYSDDREAGLVIFSVADQNTGYLILLNSETCKRVDQIEFSGAPHSLCH